tara:strand:+ start:1695 stop:1946 length:252 start_codon:yes stop_codon:yes gene_type:complete
MKDNYKELDKLSQPKSVDRHSQLSKRIDDIAKVVKDPDPWGVNISSRERVDELDKQIEEMKGEIKRLNGRIDGLNYLIKQLIK